MFLNKFLLSGIRMKLVNKGFTNFEKITAGVWEIFF
jgi:hypothetical protein